VFLFPFYYMVVGALQREPDSDVSGAFPNPANLTLDNLRDINQAINLPRTLLNSGIFTGGVLLCTLLLGLLAGYALARLEFGGGGMVFNAMLLILIVPFQLLMIPLYVMIVRGYLLGDTYLGMILPFAVNATAVFIFLQLPRELFESARLDGASELKILTRIAVPLERWERLGPVGFAFEPGLRTDLNLYPNKDALLFPEPVPGPGGEPAFALLHRPMWDLSWANPAEGGLPPPGLPDPRPGIWVSFAPAKEVLADPVRLTSLRDHRLVALPERPWEEAKLGGGTPPLRVGGGWLVLHHEGIVPNVVFPTAIDRRSEHEADIYYGTADARIGAFRLTMAPLSRPTGGPPRRSSGPSRT
jgi:hypothetical protein